MDTPTQAPPIDPLRRVLVPVERIMPDGTHAFGLYGTYYIREKDGSIHRSTKKARGKAARRADKAARRK